MNILIIGTSHSVSSCKRKPIIGKWPDSDMGRNDIMLEGRWQDLLGEHYGVDVFTLARSGVSIEDQIDKVHLYSQMNHEKRYDLAIVEGRTMQNSIGAPIQLDDSVDTTPCKEAYMHWTDEFKKLNGERPNPLNQINTLYSNHVQKEYKKYGPWFVDYVDSYLQAVQVWSMNLALCTLLDAFCDKVLWYTFNGTHSVDKFHPLNTMGYEFLKKYALFTQDTYFAGADTGLDEDPDYKYHCYCNHLNELGHKMLFNKILKPRLDELKIFIK